MVFLIFASTRAVDFFIHRFSAPPVAKKILPFGDELISSDPGIKEKPSSETTSALKFSFYKTLFQQSREKETFSIKGNDKQQPKGEKKPAKTLKPVLESKHPKTNKTQQQTKAIPPNSIYTIQLGSFTNAKSAKSFAAELKRKGYKSYIVTTKLPEHGTVWRVRIGHFRDLSKAQKLALEIEKQEGKPVLITSR